MRKGAGMNREEAIKILKEHHNHWMRLYKEGICTEEEGKNTIEALEMAIKALEQNESAEEWYKLFVEKLEQEPCDVFDEYGNYKYPSDFELIEPNTATSVPCDGAISRQAVLDLAKKGVLVSNGNYKSVCKAINELPPVNPTKTGYWIDTGSGQECSECHEIQYGYDSFRFYCAKCGSKNVAESEG